MAWTDSRYRAQNPRNQERIFPYLGGEELNTNPTHSHHRYVIHFGEMTEEEARKWPDLMRIVEEKVKPERNRQNDRGAKEKWWQFIRARPELHAAITGLDRVLAISRVSQYVSFGFLRTPVVPSDGLVVFPFSTCAPFAVLQSRIHEIWARFFGSSMKDDLRYTPSDCFETFPLGWESDARLEAVGREYYDFRAHLMVKNHQGLTATYNRFHDPEEFDPDILRLRALHDAMDRAVLSAYGFDDLHPQCTFLLDYQEEEATATEAAAPTRDRKKPWRYRFADELRDEVLARLLAENSRRAQVESETRVQAAILGESRPKSTQPRGKKSPPKPPSDQGALF